MNKSNKVVNNRLKIKRRRKKNKYLILSIIILGSIISFYVVDALGVNYENESKYVGSENGDETENMEVDIEDSLIADNTETKVVKDKIEDNEYLMLINKDSHINKEYIPEDLKIPNITFRVADDMCMEMRVDAADAIENMFNDAKTDRIELIGISGYRSYEYQKIVYNRSIVTEGQEYTESYVAIPGTSEHQTGLVMDILSSEYLSLDEGFEDTRAFKWLSQNMSKYGFILRYPKGKESITGYDYEPWHLRYVGVDAAKEIMDKDITLEEYLGY